MTYHFCELFFELGYLRPFSPPATLYYFSYSFHFFISAFRAEHRKMPKGMQLSGSLPSDLESLVGRIGVGKTLPMVDAMSILSELDAALENVDRQRDSIIALHQQVMHKVSPSVDESFESYEERQLAHAMMSHPRRPLDLDAFSQGMRIQSMHAEKMMDTLRERLMRDFSTSSGAFVSGRDSMPLPWWMAK